MAASDEERREVAAKLSGEAQAWMDTFPDEVCDLGDMPGAMQDLGHFAGLRGKVLYSDFFQRFADLIDRPTCHNASGCDDVFKCSECGAEFEPIAVNGNEYGDVFYTPLKPQYCSACGAEVVE